MILGADFLSHHHAYFASSQGKFYFSYLGGRLFDAPPVAAAAPAAPVSAAP
jgi:hypothetical protein